MVLYFVPDVNKTRGITTSFCFHDSRASFKFFWALETIFTCYFGLPLNEMPYRSRNSR